MNIVIYGGPGSGKSMLLLALRERLKDAGFIDGNVENPQIRHHFGQSDEKREPFSIQAPVRNYMVCASCGLCAKKCPFEAINKEDLWIDPLECEGCGICAQHCPQKALQMVNMQVGQLVKVKDNGQTLFYGELMPGAQGGPLMVEELLKKARQDSPLVLSETYGLGEAAARLLSGADAVVLLMGAQEEALADRLFGLPMDTEKYLVLNMAGENESVEEDLLKGAEEKGFKLLAKVEKISEPEKRNERFGEIAQAIVSEIAQR